MKKLKTMKKLLLILLCVPLFYSCGEKEKDNTIKKLKKEIDNLERTTQNDIEYINLPRIKNTNELNWRGLLKEYEMFRIFLYKGEILSLPPGYLAGELNYGEINPGLTANMKDDNYEYCDKYGAMWCFKSLKSDYYYFWITNRLSNGADDEIVDSFTNYKFIINQK
jgi:hypothetical protein